MKNDFFYHLDQKINSTFNIEDQQLYKEFKRFILQSHDIPTLNLMYHAYRDRSLEKLFNCFEYYYFISDRRIKSYISVTKLEKNLDKLLDNFYLLEKSSTGYCISCMTKEELLLVRVSGIFDQQLVNLENDLY